MPHACDCLDMGGGGGGGEFTAGQIIIVGYIVTIVAIRSLWWVGGLVYV